MKKLFLISLLLSSVLGTVAQEITLDEAIDFALKHNYGILQQQNGVEMQENMATRGQAGYLPTVSASGMADYGLDNTRAQFQGNPEALEVNWAESRTYTASLKADYTLFNGFARKYNYEKLTDNVLLTEADARLQIENVLLQVANAYFNVLRTKENVKVLEKTLEISRERVKYAAYLKELSGGSNLNYLSATVDYNKDSVEFINATKAYNDACLDLNHSMGRSLETSIEINSGFEINRDLNLDTLRAQVFRNNANYNSAKMQEQVSMLDYKITKSAYLPQLNLSASYGYNNSQSEGGFLAVNQSDGLGVALSLSIPIYNGGKNRIQEQNAAIVVENRQLAIDELKLNLSKTLLKAYTDYTNALQILSLEQENIKTTELNFSYTEELYKSGQATSIDFRQAQNNLLLGRNNLNNLKYNAKLAEIELLRLTGRIIGQ
jgi:outer membrane protein